MPCVSVTAAQLLSYLTPLAPLTQHTPGDWCLGARSHCKSIPLLPPVMGGHETRIWENL